MTAGSADHPLRIVRLFPDLLGTYGDDGNGIVLAQRARWRDHSALVLDVRSGMPIPDDGHVYLIGGGEDGPQTTAAHQLAASGALARAVERGASVLAVCAGFQLLGRRFLGPGGEATDGLGLLDVVTERGTGPRMVGDVVSDVDASLGLPPMTGYENHAGVTRLGEAARPLGRVRAGCGVGNGIGDASEGVLQGRVVATYLHGPVLARNPALADLLLGWALDVDPADLEPLDDRLAESLRAERLHAAASLAGR